MLKVKFHSGLGVQRDIHADESENIVGGIYQPNMRELLANKDAQNGHHNKSANSQTPDGTEWERAPLISRDA